MPPRASSADNTQTPQQIAGAIETFLAQHADAQVLEEGRVLFDLAAAKYSITAEHGRCTLQLWSDAANVVRRVVSCEQRGTMLQLATQRFGQAPTRLVELVPSRGLRTVSTREAHRKRFLQTLERVLLRAFAEWKPVGLHSAMDLEKSFGPAYARGMLLRGNRAWAVIAVNDAEPATTIDGILTLGVLWLETCREREAGRRVVTGLRVIVPQRKGATTLARLRWMNHDAAQWEMYELDERGEELVLRDADDQGNMTTRLLHRPDAAAAASRFAGPVARVLALVPRGEQHRVQQHLRSAAEIAFTLHGLEFARARLGYAGNSFAQAVEITIGSGAEETPLTVQNEDALRGVIADLFARRAVHAADRAQDVLYRRAPERWLESVLRDDLAALTRHLAPQPAGVALRRRAADDETAGNRADASAAPARRDDVAAGTIPRLDPAHVYTQVSAFAGAGDRGVLDLLGVTDDGRIVVIELKADEDLHFAMQGLDYWVRIRHHLRASQEGSGNELQRHGYFTGIQLSGLEPRLYLVAPALRVHPATERVLRYISPRIEWHLLALNERWRSRVKVVWRKDSGRG